ncbi:hypothetical protein B0T20DRAFT_409987 [Sordaria brevicollis]|uniref:F-box domain-containing protein n=1 Tax=Sordaria brevicollis TaxID=83679 RepID=A0AAE0PG87_SORBR|nr:hypothetical protein B0T20DRAFT_409987 [Sordaria brevicollis]
MSTSPGASRKRKASDVGDNESHDPRRRPESPASLKPTTTTTTTTTLMDLPTELKNRILDYLTPIPPDISESCPEPYDKLVREDPWYDFTRRRSALRNLCLVSRFWASLARPYLYNTIAITSGAVLVLLFRTITENPQYSSWTRFLSCHLTLSNERVVRSTRVWLKRLLPTWRQVKGLMEYVAGYLTTLQVRTQASESYDEYLDAPQGILAMIITTLSKLETLFLQVPAIEDDLDYFQLLSCLRMALSHFDTAVGQKCRDYFASMYEDEGLAELPSLRREPNALIPFQHLTTLLLQGDPSVEDPTTLDDDEDDDSEAGDLPEVFGVQIRHYDSLLRLLPALTTVEVSTDDGIFSLLELEVDEDHELTGGFYDPDPHSLPKKLIPAKHIYLHESIADPRNIGRILRHAPNLETLYMQPRRVDSFHRIPPQDSTVADDDCLDQALAKYGNTKLKHLDLNWFDCQGSEASIGVGGRLSTLPLLSRIEKLCLQLVLLYGDLPEGEIMMAQTHIADLLPPNLVELALEDWWWESLDDFDTFYRWSEAQRDTHYKEKEGYRRTVLVMLGDLAAVSGKNSRPMDRMKGGRKMHNLKKVRFFIRTLPTWIPPMQGQEQVNNEDNNGNGNGNGFDNNGVTSTIPEGDGQDEKHVLGLFADIKEMFEKAGVEFEVELDQPLEVMEMMEDMEQEEVVD